MTIKYSSMQYETVGEYLRNIREQKNISLDEISKSTKIKLHFLKAIEDEQIKDITDLAYARLTVLNYARYVGANLTETLNLFNKNIQKRPAKKVIGFRINKKEDYEKKILIPRIVFQVLILIIFVGALFGLGYYLHQKGELQRNIFKEPQKYLSEQEAAKESEMDKIKETLGDTTSIKQIEFKYKSEGSTFGGEEKLLKKYILNDKHSPWYIMPKYIKSRKTAPGRSYKNRHKEQCATGRY
ncbi:MAG: helix-turn-helix domain-containing protein [Candidatus Cloacimonadota bacterium]|nr:helix-turn-helix domain-containing protein [Candidatus Cloacimonadota bacterium]